MRYLLVPDTSHILYMLIQIEEGTSSSQFIKRERNLFRGVSTVLSCNIHTYISSIRCGDRNHLPQAHLQKWLSAHYHAAKASTYASSTSGKSYNFGAAIPSGTLRFYEGWWGGNWGNYYYQSYNYESKLNACLYVYSRMTSATNTICNYPSTTPFQKRLWPRMKFFWNIFFFYNIF